MNRFEHKTFWPALLFFISVALPMYWSTAHYFKEYETYLLPDPWTSTSDSIPTKSFKPGEVMWIHWNTRINYSRCKTTYAPRAEHTTLALPTLRFPEHTGHYAKENNLKGKKFISKITLPKDIQEGPWVYYVITDVQCWPFGFGDHTYISPKISFNVIENKL